tara:strand:+ start:310 stop:735 length:426 start_codon:yes stop_codon:yes gene_type:complete
MGTFDSLDKTFGVEPEVKPIKKQKADIVISNKSEDKEKDYRYARAQIYDLVEKMQEAVDGALEVAQQSDHPRAYEVVMNGAKNAAEVVEKLGDLHKKMNDIEAEASKPNVMQQGGTQQNIFMSGSTTDLMKAIKEMNKDES